VWHGAAFLRGLPSRVTISVPVQDPAELGIGQLPAITQYPQLFDVMCQLDPIQLQLSGIFGVELMIDFDFASQIHTGLANEMAMMHRFDRGFEGR
jgi:hypothetical protein